MCDTDYVSIRSLFTNLSMTRQIQKNTKTLILIVQFTFHSLLVYDTSFRSHFIFYGTQYEINKGKIICDVFPA